MTAETATRDDSRDPVAVPPESVTAVVLTHMRPGLAGDMVRSLLEVEGFVARRVVVVVNGVGGLDDPALEKRVRMVRLPVNTGPAGGFRAGLLEACTDPSTRWIYLCEDDVGLFALGAPRVATLLDRVESLGRRARPVGAAVAYGRNFVGRGAHTENVVPPPGAPQDLSPVHVACWGATLVSRSVVDAGVLPDPDWFFGLEDVDFFCRMREGGFEVLLDDVAARRIAGQQTDAGREAALQERRPTDDAEPWRRYYHARNSFAVVRRHGRPSWYGWLALYSVRHLQAARGRVERVAIVQGLWDGLRGKMGENPRYARALGEFSPPPESGDTEPEAR